MKNLAIAVVAVMAVLVFAPAAFAEDGGATGGINPGLIALGAGLGLGIAAFGGGLGQGRTAAAALEGIARNPSASDKLFVPMILGLALIESLVIYAFVIAMLMQLKF